MQPQVTIKTLYRMKEKGEKIVALTAYDFPFARMVDESGVHLILVGDSLGMVVQGESSTLPVTMDEMVYHTRCLLCLTSQARARQLPMQEGFLKKLEQQRLNLKEAQRSVR